MPLTLIEQWKDRFNVSLEFNVDFGVMTDI